MKKYFQKADVIPVEAQADASADDPVLVGKMIGFWTSDVKSGDTGQVLVGDGMVEDAPKATGTQWDQGDYLTFDGTNFDVTDGSDIVVGHAGYDADSADDTGFVILGAKSFIQSDG